MSRRDPILHPVAILDLHPTQFCVGMREVKEKRKRWKEMKGDEAGEFVGRHLVPVIIGPKKEKYLIDHHHLCRAVHDAGGKEVLVNIIADLSGLGKGEFWCVMDDARWVYPYDASGKRRAFDDLPKTIEKLTDDPFRSLAGELRRAGGYAKDLAPFHEFIYADFLRRRMKRGHVEKNFDKAMERALKLVKSEEAGHLPGWCGPHK